MWGPLLCHVCAPAIAWAVVVINDNALGMHVAMLEIAFKMDLIFQHATVVIVRKWMPLKPPVGADFVHKLVRFAQSAISILGAMEIVTFGS